jgi:hypothetical protein
MPPVYHYGSNEPTSTLASQFEWSVNKTLKPAFNAVKKPKPVLFSPFDSGH